MPGKKPKKTELKLFNFSFWPNKWEIYIETFITIKAIKHLVLKLWDYY